MSYILYFQLKLYAAQLIHYPRIDNTYKAKAFTNLTNDISYGGVTFDADHPYLLFCFQFLFPLVVIILFMMYSHWWLIKKCQDSHNWAVDPDSWAITIAHAIISSTLIVYILALDIAALKFREDTPEYYNENYNVFLYRYPGTVLCWDILPVIVIIAVLIFIALAVKDLNNDAAMNICCHKVKLPRAKTVIFLLLKLTGVVPLLPLAAHAHYIIIAWITDPLYATGIGIDYAIFYVSLLVVLKLSCKRTKQFYDSWTKHKSDKSRICFGCFAILGVFAVWFVSLSFQVLVTIFFIYIPINHSIEDTPSTLLTIIQGIGAVFLGLIAWKVIVDPRSSGKLGSLSIISGALRKAIKKKGPTCKLHGDSEWDGFNEEEKLAEVLSHVIKISNAPN